jgi:predicted RNA-binding protein YlxR (DUF448 family)
MIAEPASLRLQSPDDERARRCIVTSEVLPQSRLVRFVLDPQGNVVPDVAAKLPGRGMWVSARREIVERAVAKGHFSRAAKVPVVAAVELPRKIETLLVSRMTGDLGLARRSGQIVLGFDNVARALGSKSAPCVLVEASDGARDGRRKLLALAKGGSPHVIDCLASAELSLALGRENVVHAALKSGPLSERLTADAGRLAGFRPVFGHATAPPTAAAGSVPAGNKGQE